MSVPFTIQKSQIDRKAQAKTASTLNKRQSNGKSFKKDLTDKLQRAIQNYEEKEKVTQELIPIPKVDTVQFEVRNNQTQMEVSHKTVEQSSVTRSLAKSSS